MLQILSQLPETFLQFDAKNLYQIFPKPTLVDIPGDLQPAIFVSVLLHGNEDTGLGAVQELLRRYAGGPLPRAMTVFFGNVAAAKEGLRRLPDQPDFNRIWIAGTTPEHMMVHQVVEHMRERGVFASVDIHNNTGVNPHYACINRTDAAFLQLANLFGRTIVYFTRPEGVQSATFAELCPSVVVECGKVGEASGIIHAADFLEACLRLTEFPQRRPAHQDYDLYHTVAIVRIPDYCSLAFSDTGSDIVLRENLDHLNFTELAPRTLIGKIREGCEARLVVSDEHGRDVGEQYFDYSNGQIRTKVSLMPSMFTLDLKVIRQDCLGYLMERFKLE